MGKQIKITSPVPTYNGEVGRIRFQDGQATIDSVDDAAFLAYFEAHGYGIEGHEPTPDPVTPGIAPGAELAQGVDLSDPEALGKLSNEQLDAIAAGIENLDGTRGLVVKGKKSDKVDAIVTAELAKRAVSVTTAPQGQAHNSGRDGADVENTAPDGVAPTEDRGI